MSDAILALVEEDTLERLEKERAELWRRNDALLLLAEEYKAALELVLVNARGMTAYVEDKQNVPSRVVLRISDVIADLAQTALGRAG